MLLFLALTAFFIALAVYYLSFKFPNFLVFMSIFVNVLDLLIIMQKFGGIDFIKALVR